MLFTAENILLIGSVLLFVSIIVGKTGYRFGVPALLLFLVVGMLFGSDGLGLQFHNAKEAQFIGMVALSIILFSVRYGHQIYRNKAYSESRYCPVHRRGIIDCLVHRIIYLVAIRYELDQYPSSAYHFTTAGIYHVIYGFSLRLCHPAFTKNELET